MGLTFTGRVLDGYETATIPRAGILWGGIVPATALRPDALPVIFTQVNTDRGRPIVTKRIKRRR